MNNVNRAFIERLIDDINRSIEEILEYTNKPFETLSNAEKYTIRYLLIIIAEAITAIALHIARRALNIRPETPIHAFKALRDHGLIDEYVYEELVKFIRVRNLIVHRYWIVDDRLIYENIKSDFRAIREFIKAIEKVVGYG